MALPWLIGGAIVGGIALVGAALSDNEESSSGGSNNDDEEERRLRKEAEEKRKQLEKTKAREQLTQTIIQRGNEEAKIFQSLLSSVITLEYQDSTPFLYGQEDRQKLDHLTVHNDIVIAQSFYGLTDISEETLENLETLLSLYEVEINPTIELKETSAAFKKHQKKLNEIEVYKERLSKKRIEMEEE